MLAKSETTNRPAAVAGRHPASDEAGTPVARDTHGVQRLLCTLQDVGGPPYDEPKSTGFGIRMLRRALAAELGGKASLHYEPDGLRYELVAPARDEL